MKTILFIKYGLCKIYMHDQSIITKYLYLPPEEFIGSMNGKSLSRIERAALF
jgi:hypothetical protein